jgi:hypothetical protein
MHFIDEDGGIRLIHRGESVCRILPAGVCGFWQILFADGRNSDPLRIEECKANALRWAMTVWLRDPPAPKITQPMREHLHVTRQRERGRGPDDECPDRTISRGLRPANESYAIQSPARVADLVAGNVSRWISAKGEQHGSEIEKEAQA